MRLNSNFTPAPHLVCHKELGRIIGWWLITITLILPPYLAHAQLDTTDSTPKWRWEALLAALDDESHEVRSKAIIWLGSKTNISNALPSRQLATKIAQTIVQQYHGTDDEVLLISRVKALGNLGVYSEAALPHLISWLTNHLQEIREPAAKIAISIGSKAQELAPDLVALITNKNLTFRSPASEILNRLGTNASVEVPKLIQLLPSEDVSIQAHAIRALEGMGPSIHTGIEPLLEMTRYAQPTVRMRAIQAIGFITPYERRPTATLSLAASSDPDPAVRQTAIEALSRGRESENTLPSELLPFLNDPDPSVRTKAVMVFATIKNLPAVGIKALVTVTEDNDEQVRAAAINALSTAAPNYTNHVQTLINNLAHESWHVRQEAENALGKMSDLAPRILPHLLALLQKDVDPVLRRSAIVVLRNLGTRSSPAKADIRNLLTSRDPSTISIGLEALGALGTEACDCVDIIVDLSLDGNREVSGSAHQAIMGMPGCASQALGRRLANHDPKSQERILSLLFHLGPNASDQSGPVSTMLSSPHAQIEAIQVLGAMGEGAAREAPKLAALLNAANQDIVILSLQSLREMGPSARAVTSQIAAHLGSTNQALCLAAVNAIGAMGPEASRHAIELAQVLASTSKPIRLATLEALQRMGVSAAQAAPSILQHLSDDSPSFREAVFKTLMAISEDPQAKPALASLDMTYRADKRRGILILNSYLNGGPNPTNLLAIRWLASREGARSVTHVSNKDDAKRILPMLKWAWTNSEGLSNLRQRIASLALDCASFASAMESHERLILSDFRESFGSERDLVSFGDAIAHALVPRPVRIWLTRIGKCLGLHATFWILLIYVYPKSSRIQSLFIWNKWFRRLLGLGYVGMVIHFVPFVRRRLFAPFKESLLPSDWARDYNSGAYFEERYVVQVDKSGRELDAPKKLSLELVSDPTIRGGSTKEDKNRLMIIGSAGIGKTSAMRWLAFKSPNVVVVLRATDCGHGVIRAIQTKVPVLNGDEGLLRSLVFSRDIEVFIDALNESSAEARVEVRKFVSEFGKARITLSTQLISPEQELEVFRYKLLPLNTNQIGDFLKMQWTLVRGIAEKSGVTHTAYKEAIDEFMQDMASGPSNGGQPCTKSQVLSNPLDAQTAAQLIASGRRNPSYLNLFDAVLDEMRRDYSGRFGKEFPSLRIAEAICSWRAVDDPAVAFDESLEDAACVLCERQLIVKQVLASTSWPSGGASRHRWLSRHDRIMDMLMLPVFMGAKKEEVWDRHFNDERFWGVYELLATRLPLAAEHDLYQRINWATAASTLGPSDRYSRSGKAQVASYGVREVNLNELRNRYEIARTSRLDRQHFKRDDVST